MLEVTLLSILQGIAEFLPISSSGHLVLGKELLGLGDTGMRLDIFLHVGTLLAVFAFYLKVIVRIVKECDWRYLLKIVLSAVPAGIVGICFKDHIEAAFQSPLMVGFALIFTGLTLTITKVLPKGDKSVTTSSALLMGVAQALAIIPGVSRSGMTLVAARSAKVEAAKSAEFSFLMSSLPIAGAAILEIMEATPAVNEVSWGLTLYGALLSAIVGYISLALLLKSLKSDKFWLFGPYCLIAGITTIGLA